LPDGTGGARARDAFELSTQLALALPHFLDFCFQPRKISRALIELRLQRRTASPRARERLPKSIEPSVYPCAGDNLLGRGVFRIERHADTTL
jgi:hypothetical protein